MDSKGQVYCKAAIFKCSYCEYETDIYSNLEWIVPDDDQPCIKCKITGVNVFSSTMIFRHDLGGLKNDIPLHGQFAKFLFHDLCAQCSNRNLIHWTEAHVHCMKCNKDSMTFQKYTEGKNIALVYEECIDSLKSAHEPIIWKMNDGVEHMNLNEPDLDVSAS
jgi:hypothetical protein